MATLTANKSRYDELMKNPLIFLHLNDNSHYNNEGQYVEDITWNTNDKDISGSFSRDVFSGNSLGFVLAIAEQISPQEYDKKKENDFISFKIHEANAEVLDDWRIVINSFIIRSKDSQDNYPYLHLLWFLNFNWWNSESLIKALNIYDIRSIPYIINNALVNIARCLSEQKQQELKKALAQYNINYSIYIPGPLKEAIKNINPSPKNEYAMNLFSKVDYILEDESFDNIKERNIDNNSKNIFLCLYQWLNDSGAIIDYSSLCSLASVTSTAIQMQLVKRYFHDIRMGRTALDLDLIKQFKDNPFSDFIRYRYCIETPELPIDLAVPLLCDCILTLCQTNGNSFQSFDGIMDFAITRCDVTKPAVNLGMEKFLPLCDGGAVYNPDFRGFVDYSIVCELDESKFTEDNLKETILDYLDRRQHLSYYACGYDEENIPLTDSELAHCLSKRKVKDKITGKEYLEQKFSCTKICQYKYKWIVWDYDYAWLNTFLVEPLPQVDGHSQVEHKQIIIDISQTSTDVLAKYIRSLISQCEKIDDNKFVVLSKDVRALNLLLQYSKPISLRIIPNSQPVVGMRFDVFGILKNLRKENNYTGAATEQIKSEFNRRESEELRKRVIESLKQELKQEFNGSYFEIEYDRELRRKILGQYYFRGSMHDKPTDLHREFLVSQDNKKFKPFCSPKIADAHNRATDLPFFWCRGTECFHNCLYDQTLETGGRWWSYSLFHLIEIIGYPKLHMTEAGFEPDSTVTEFIACANRVLKKFKRLKCRNCGHLMFTDRSSGYNRYNYYSCINPTCTEYMNPVYLSYCFKCKTGLIDSRDSVQCPNGWYICPSCHSCCDDAQYERQAQRYIVQNRPVPQRIKDMLGKGHNDKGIFFCHTCGNELQYFKLNNEQVWGCPICKIEYKKST
ncbi:hypothetical protein [Prevotella sp. P6B1]|uniref:hypothetical protein n=1 Tax=Prevotella sp. P6B1 TaxID=1410613 RepID=UPI00051C96A3|nr:hypothetical protein [Prevotella sp. P6B1]